MGANFDLGNGEHSPKNNIGMLPGVDAAEGHMAKKQKKNFANWHFSANIDSPVFTDAYLSDAVIECSGYVIGQDPFGTGLNKWAKSSIGGFYCWEGNLEDGITGLDEIGTVAPNYTGGTLRVDNKGGTAVYSAPRNDASTRDDMFMEYGNTCTFDSVVDGEDIDGNNKWFVLYGDPLYVWSGDCSIV